MPDSPSIEHGEVGDGDLLDALAHQSDLAARSDQRRGAVGAAARARQRPPAVRALDLHQQPGDRRRRREHLPRARVDLRARDRRSPRSAAAARTAGRARRARPCRDAATPPSRSSRRQIAVAFSKRAQLLFEPLAHQARLAHDREARASAPRRSVAVAHPGSVPRDMTVPITPPSTSPGWRLPNGMPCARGGNPASFHVSPVACPIRGYALPIETEQGMDGVGNAGPVAGRCFPHCQVGFARGALLRRSSLLLLGTGLAATGLVRRRSGHLP